MITTIPLWLWALAALALLLLLVGLQWLAAEAENARLRRERSHWESRYWDLLADDRLDEPDDDWPGRGPRA